MSLYLCYDSESKRLVKQLDCVCGEHIQEHNEEGYNSPLAKQTLEIPESNAKITVETNLHYGAASFMKASMMLNDKIVFNFHSSSLSCSISKIEAKPGDWNALFDNIITLYNSRYNSEIYIDEYFDHIKEAINAISSSCDVRIELVIKRLSEILNKLPESIFYDNILVSNRIKEACALLFQKIISDGTDELWDKTRQKSVESNIDIIFSCLSDRKEILDVFEIMHLRSIISK